MCYELVFIKKEKAFTNSKIISMGTNVKHKNVKELIVKYKKELKKFGNLSVSNVGVNGTSNYEEFYILNEMQATFLITLMRNNETVVNFKIKLVKGFYLLRQALLEKQSVEWKETRIKGKLTRRNETDIIATYLIPLAVKQGSKNYAMFYTNYTKLINKLLDLPPKSREKATYKTLQAIEVLENMIEGTIKEEATKGTYYKDIYKICKAKGNMMAEYLYLPKQRLLK